MTLMESGRLHPRSPRISMAIEGIDEIHALTLVSELGTDFTKWPTVKHFASWAHICGDSVRGWDIVPPQRKQGEPTQNSMPCLERGKRNPCSTTYQTFFEPERLIPTAQGEVGEALGTVSAHDSALKGAVQAPSMTKPRRKTGRCEMYGWIARAP